MKIKVDTCFLSPSRAVVGVKGSTDEAALELCFSRDWEGLERRAVFRTADGLTLSAPCEGSRVRIPDEVMMTHGKVSFAIVGKGGARQKTTLAGELYILNTVDGGEDGDK